MIWNGTMRKQLTEYISSRIETLQNGGGVGAWDMGSMLEYSNLASELLVDGVYIRVYNEHPDFVLPNPNRPWMHWPITSTLILRLFQEEGGRREKSWHKEEEKVCESNC